MAQNQRRSGFRLRWGDEPQPKPEETPASEQAEAPAVPDPAPTADAQSGAPSTEAAAASDTSAPPPADATPFLRELVDAMRGVAESSRDANLGELRSSLESRVEALRATGTERADELLRRSELDIGGIGDWERAEIERIRAEAEQKREARRAQLEQQLTEQQASTEREIETARRRLADYEQQVAAFFAELAEIQDPAAFVAAVKRMPPLPDLGAGGGASDASASPAQAPAAASAAATDGDASLNGSRVAAESALAERLAQLDQRLAAAPGQASAPTPAALGESAATGATTSREGAVATAAATPTAGHGPHGEISTPIVVKGLGSFGAITSFKQALERVDGIRGVTLSLGPTGEFVYRASHASEFDIVDAIRKIEGPEAGIEQSEGSVLVSIARQR